MATEETKIKELTKIYFEIKRIANAQINLVKKHEKNKNIPKEIAHYYVYNVLKDFWGKIEFFVTLKNNKFRKYNGLILRSILEEFLQFCYFTKIDTVKKNHLVIKEIVRIYKKIYDRDVNTGRNLDEIQNIYDGCLRNLEISKEELQLPQSLKDCKIQQINPFPKAREMMKDGKGLLKNSDIDKWYDDYSYFSEETHNGLVVNAEKNEKINYRQNLSDCIMYARYMLELINIYYLNQKFKSDVIKIANLIKNYSEKIK